MSNKFEKLEKLAELKDKGVVTTEEFEAQKKILLNEMDSCSLTPDDSRWIIVLLLCLFVGYLGIHRFYIGRTTSGLLQLLTLGGLGIWVFIDFIRIIVGDLEDANGNKVAPPYCKN